MFKNLLLITISLVLYNCTAPTKEQEVKIDQQAKSSDDGAFEDYTDSLGEKLSVSTNKERDSKTIKFNGSTYVLKKELESHSYSTSDNEYQFSENKSEITFLKKDYNMVLYKKKKNTQQTASQMQ